MKKYVLVFSLLFIMALVGYVWLDQNTGVTTPNVSTVDTQNSDITLPPKVAQPALKTTEIINKQALPLAQAAQNIVPMYAHTLTFPPYSQPLSHNDFTLLNPNHFYPIKMPTNDTGSEISLALSKYRYHPPETIEYLLTGDITTAQIIISEQASSTVLSQVQVTPVNGVYSGKIAGKSNWPASLSLTVKAQTPEDKVNLVANFQYQAPSATLVKVHPPYTKHADMVFDLTLDVHQKGIYRVRANLLDQDNNPISHLVSKARLKDGLQTIKLAAHQSVFFQQSSASTATQFILTQFVIEKMSSLPGEKAQFGDSKVKQYDINDFYIDGLDRQDYQPSAHEKQKLAFLKSLAE
ncbi:hypothetical protein [Pseudoalteromonas aurantia]|nr:hypothetical protein [Pseudoalteromonas aurantia]